MIKKPVPASVPASAAPAAPAEKYRRKKRGGGRGGGAGRPSKFDDLRAHRIISAIRDGHSIRAAARAGGIEGCTLQEWRRRGKQGDEQFVLFSRRVEEALQYAEERCVKVLKDALESDDLRLATDTAWKWLARRRPEEWSDSKDRGTGSKPDELEAAAADTSADDLAIVESVRAALLSRKVG